VIVTDPEAQPAPLTAVPNLEHRPHRLAAALNLTFHNIELLRLALTHRSVAHELRASAPDLDLPEADRSNERLEFLGDAVLGYVVAMELYQRFPEAPEGELTARRVSLVRAERLVTWARSIELGDYLYLAQGERVSESSRDRILAGAFEALIGAIALDSGIDEAREFMIPFLDQDVESALAANIAANPKGQLQEYLQEHYRQPPVYRIIDVTGPEHARTFTAEVLAEGQPLGVGAGESKRMAEQAAADQALLLLDQRRRATPPRTVRKRRRAPAVKGTPEDNG
jgi:ribonuclease-3